MKSLKESALELYQIAFLKKKPKVDNISTD